MLKSFALLIFVLAVSNADTVVDNYFNSSVLHTDAYINLNKQQHLKNVQDYDKSIEKFKQSYAASLNAVQIKGDMLIDSLIQTNEHYNSLEVLSELSGTCVGKYRKSLATVSSIKSLNNGCINAAQSQINTILSSVVATKTYLENYYSSNYESYLYNCKNKFSSQYYYFNYTTCVVDATNAAQDYTITNQKTFASQMKTARCAAETNIMKALECSYAIQNRTISQIAEANTLVNKCLLGQDNCGKCTVGYSCSYVTYMYRTDMSYQSKTMENIFYGRQDVKDCLMLKIKY